MRRRKGRERKRMVTRGSEAVSCGCCGEQEPGGLHPCQGQGQRQAATVRARPRPPSKLLHPPVLDPPPALPAWEGGPRSDAWGRP